MASNSTPRIRGPRWQIVDVAIDRLIAERTRRGGAEPTHTRAKTLARLVSVTVAQMTELLQDHRKAQGNKQAMRPRYVIAAESYGRAALWHILAKPSDDPVTAQQARAAHLGWVGADMARRVATDLVREIAPALRGASRDQLIADTAALLKDQVTVVVKHVDRQLARIP